MTSYQILTLDSLCSNFSIFQFLYILSDLVERISPRDMSTSPFFKEDEMSPDHLSAYREASTDVCMW